MKIITGQRVPAAGGPDQVVVEKVVHGRGDRALRIEVLGLLVLEGLEAGIDALLAAAGELGVPRIHFGVTTGELLGLMAAAGAEVVGVDWRTPLDAARTRVPAGTVLQGNLDPALPAAGWAATEPAADDRSVPVIQAWDERAMISSNKAARRLGSR